MKQLSFLISWICVGFMLVCLISGVVVSFIYYPNLAYESVLSMKSVPYGEFFRKLHYFSGELFLLTVLLHIVVELARNSKDRLNKFTWICGVVAFIAALVLMFSGYVLKGDLNGQSAAQVAFALILNTPILENFISFFKDGEQFFWRFFLLHAIIFPAILLYFLKIHAKKLFTNYILAGLAVTFLVLSFVDMPKDLDPLVMVDSVTGPWFFLGAENLLIKGIKPVMVVVFLATPFILLGFICFVNKNFSLNLINFALILWVIVYAHLFFV